MPEDDARKPTADHRPLTPGVLLIRLGAIGVVLAAAACIFAYVAGWFSPNRMTQTQELAALVEADGNHPGFRLNHAKGVCVAGTFDSTGAALPLSKAAVFAAGSVPVIGRISLAGGMPFQADKAATVRSMALRLLPKDAQEWRTGMLNIPVFVVNTAQGFYDQTLASAPDPATGKPDPVKMHAFLSAHPEAAKAMAILNQGSPSSGFADSTFYGIDAFRFVNAAGASVPVRWSLVPLQPVVAEDATQAASADKNYLFDALIAQFNAHPLQWRLIVSVGQPDDPTNDATLPWPAERQQVDAGTVTLNRVSSEDGGRCTNVNYDPLVLPSGIEASDDPLLSARSAVYTRSFTQRAAEQSEKQPSAITVQDVQSGGQR
jgi:catalase